MKIKRFIKKLFPKEGILILLGGCKAIGIVFGSLLASFYFLGILADFFNWFPEFNNVMNKGASVFLVIFLAFVFCGWIYFGFYGLRKLTKYLIKTWKES
jgi:uncharacterized membrane protein required for colicin V production